ncbi:MAG: glycine--tRNA ligase subunit beta, partial [Parachlamydia sp.]|nr:glycine--tRNA ligase subunit beta [Parachlamydia sp.]
KNCFIITANVAPSRHIVLGNEKVLTARLSDGLFLYEEDLKITFEQWNEKIKKVVQQKDLGTVHEKAKRLAKHAALLQLKLAISTPAFVEKAALLSKADLASGMVYEFPELQGTMGKYYALARGESHEVAQAIEEQWMPKGENAPLPSSETGIILSLSDRFDHLIGCYAFGLKPTSSSDPYALRRQALAIIKILIHGHFELPLKDTFKRCADHFQNLKGQDHTRLADEVIAFISQRAKSVFVEYGFLKDEIEACLSHGCHDIYDLFCRLKALHEFRHASPAAFSSLFEVYKRARGQVQGDEGAVINSDFFREDSEKRLYKLLESSQDPFDQAIIDKDYFLAYRLIAEIQPALADLFEKVRILADEKEVRENRLALLKKVFNRFERLLDFSKIQT